MTRCAEFYQKWAEDENWCLKCKSSVSLINSYLSLLTEFQTMGIPKKLTMVNLSERAARLVFQEKDIIVKNKAIDRIAELLRTGKRCTTTDVKAILRNLRNGYRSLPTIPVSAEKVKLLCGDFRDEGRKIADDSVSFVLTDPPYGGAYLELWGALGELSQRVLVPGGFLVAYVGQENLHEKLNHLAKHLTYFWTFALVFAEHNVQHHVHVFNLWKPLVAFYKPPLHLDGYIGDLIRGTGSEKDLHPWQQAEQDLLKLVEYFCPVDGTILDPMAGSGTTLAVALSQGRRCIGIDIDPQNIESIKRRLGQDGVCSQ